MPSHSSKKAKTQDEPVAKRLGDLFAKFAAPAAPPRRTVDPKDDALAAMTQAMDAMRQQAQADMRLIREQAQLLQVKISSLQRACD